jgi:alkylresorcinol/alkylpyrone synthase
MNAQSGQLAKIAPMSIGMKAQPVVPLPRLMSLATAVPEFRIDQNEAARLSGSVFDRRASDIERLLPVFGNAGIATRYLCMEPTWYLAPHGWVERSRLYVERAVELLARVAEDCIGQAGCGIDDVDGIVTVSTTGVATPSLDALVMERLKMRRDARRLPVFGLGCAGGVIGLSRATEMAQAMPGSRILLLVVELCSLTFRFGDKSASNIVAAALFGDGAAGLMIGTDADGPAFTGGGEHTWLDSLDVMGWHVEEDGLGVLFSRDIPALVRNDWRPALDAFLARNKVELPEVTDFVCHPGGAKVIDALEAALDRAPGSLTEARSVLRDYGNMSAVTVLFVLERMLPRLNGGRYVMSALGPGFTAGFQMLEKA